MEAKERVVGSVTRPAEYHNQRNDCCVFALAAAAGMPYGAAMREVENYRTRGGGTNITRFLKDRDHRVANYKLVEIPIRPMTLHEVTLRYRTGRYFMYSNHHGLALVNGVETNSAPRGRKIRIIALYELVAQ